MPDRIYLLQANIDKGLLQIVVSVLFITSIWLAIHIIRLRKKTKVLLEKLSIFQTVNVTVPIKEKDAGGEPKVTDGNAGFTLPSQQANFLMQQIRNYMETEKPYLDPKFNMNKLCDALDINRTYLSSAINQKTGQRFETFINGYRIADAVELLAVEESSQYTLEYLATKVGFQSKSTFNRSFKQFTGINPSFFQRIILRDSAAMKFFFDYFEDLKSSQFFIKK